MGRGSRPVSVDEAWLGGRTVGDSGEMGETGGNTMGDGDADVARVGLGEWWECFGWEGGWAGEEDCSLEKDGWSSL